MSVTAKVVVSSVQRPGGAGPGSTTVLFGPNYQDPNGVEINSEWAVATPALMLSMTVRDEIAERHFAAGDAFTLTFDKEGSE